MNAYQTTPERRANLVKLARFLYTEPIEASQFDMDEYTSRCSTQTVIKLAHGCGTAGCAIGWGPAAGIAPDQHHRYFWQYANDKLINEIEDGDEHVWCFGSSWHKYDNSARGAAKRILWLLVNGLPDDFEEQRYGESPLCYADWTPTEADWLRAEAKPCS